MVDFRLNCPPLFLAVVAILFFPFSWESAWTADLSLDEYKPGLFFPGTTVFVETRNPASPRIVEVDMEGRTVWEYKIPPEIVHGSEPGRGADIEWGFPGKTIS